MSDKAITDKPEPENPEGSVERLVGHVCDAGTVWVILNPDGKVVAKAMSDTAAKEIVRQRTGGYHWDEAHRLGFRAAVAIEQYVITGVLVEMPNTESSDAGGVR